MEVSEAEVGLLFDFTEDREEGGLHSVVVKGGLAGLSIAKDLVTNPFIVSLLFVRKSLVGQEGKSLSGEFCSLSFLPATPLYWSLTL